MDKKESFEFSAASSDGFDYERFALEEKFNSTDKASAGRKRNTSKHRQEAPSNVQSEVYDWLQCLVAALLICVLVFAFFVRIIGIIGSSMVPTFHDNDSVVISNLFYEPKQGDVVVLRKFSFQDKPIIKRVIAVENQTVDINFETGVVYVDGQPLSEPYIAEPTLTPINFDGKITVPENCVFVMGDNRNNSTDSRDSRIGCVDTRYVMGKVLLRILPLNQFGVFQ